MSLQNITSLFSQQILPKKALVFYGSDLAYVELYDINRKGNPINAHPLRVDEARRLAKSLSVSKKTNYRPFLKPKGLLPPHVLWVNTEPNDEVVIWYTPPSLRSLLFTASLDIPNGEAPVPALIWKATLTGLHVWALETPDRPTDLKTTLYHAPFFNVGAEGSVCMGTVKISQQESYDCLEAFISHWEHLFFNSYFSHANHNSLSRTNIVHLWKNLIEHPVDSFPVDQLMPTHTQLNSIIP